MLTPGEWLQSAGLMDAFFNPTFWPTLVYRTGICILLAGLYAMLIATRYPAGRFRTGLVRRNALWSLAGLAIMAPTFYWFRHAIPAAIRDTAQLSMSTPIGWINHLYLATAIVAALVLLFGLLLPKMQHMAVALATMAVAFTLFGSFEFFRESIRKPYIVSQYMYGNGIEVARSKTLQQEGLLTNIAFRSGNDGADLFRRACRSCHTLSGYKPLAPALNGLDREFVAALVQGVGVIKGNMPPFAGTAEEAGLIADHLLTRTDRRPLREIYQLNGIELGRKVYEVRCGSCHVPGGHNDKTESLAGMDADEYLELLDIADDMGEEMPAFTGGEDERDALVRFLMTIDNERGDS